MVSLAIPTQRKPSSCRSQAPPVAHGRGLDLAGSLQKGPRLPNVRIGTGDRVPGGPDTAQFQPVKIEHERLVIRVPDPFSGRRNSVAVMRKCATIRSRRSANAAQAGSHHGHCQRNRFIPTPRRWSGCRFRSSREGGLLAGDLVATHFHGALGHPLEPGFLVEVCVCMSIAVAIAFSLRLAGCGEGTTGPKGALVPSGRRVNLMGRSPLTRARSFFSPERGCSTARHLR